MLARASTALGRIQNGRSEKGIVLVGLRGVGKTVLLSEIRRRAEAAKFRICEIEAHEGKRLPAFLVPQLRRVLLELDRLESLSEQVKRALRVLKSFMNGVKTKIGEMEISLDIDAEAGTADSGDIEADLPELLSAVGRAAQARRTALALFIDEIQYFDASELSALIMAMHRIAQDQLPVILFAAGLPQIVGLFGNSKSYAERLFDFPRIGALSLADTLDALRKPARAEDADFLDEAVQHIYKSSHGYPFFYSRIWLSHLERRACFTHYRIGCAERGGADHREVGQRILPGPFRPFDATGKKLFARHGGTGTGPVSLWRSRGAFGQKINEPRAVAGWADQ